MLKTTTISMFQGFATFSLSPFKRYFIAGCYFLFGILFFSCESGNTRNFQHVNPNFERQMDALLETLSQGEHPQCLAELDLLKQIDSTCFFVDVLEAWIHNRQIPQTLCEEMKASDQRLLCKLSQKGSNHTFWKSLQDLGNGKKNLQRALSYTSMVLCQNNGNAAEFIDSLAQGKVEIGPDIAGIWSEVCWRSGNLEKALFWAEKHIQGSGETAVNMDRIANLYFQLENWPQAIAHYNRAVFLSSNSLTYQNKRNNVLRLYDELDKSKTPMHED